MATDVGFFTIGNIEQCEVQGAYPAKDADELRTGLLGVLTNGEIDLAIATSKRRDVGIVISNRTLEYRPTSAYLGDAEPLGWVRGSNIMVMADSSYFVGGSLPSAGADLYTAAGGLMDTTGTNAIGRVRNVDNVRAIPNTTKNIVVCELDLSPV